MTWARVYPVVDSAAWIARLLPLGVRLIQLRIKDRPVEQVRAQIVSAQALCAAAEARLVVNDYWECALEQGCNCVHLGQEDLDRADLAALRRAGVQIGISTHSHAELDRALSCAPDYVALGPIYPTQLKQMPWAPQGLARITQWKRLIGARPLVAIGGLTVECLPGVFAAGADIAAVVTDICRHSDPQARTREWIQAAGHGAHRAAADPARHDFAHGSARGSALGSTCDSALGSARGGRTVSGDA